MLLTFFLKDQKKSFEVTLQNLPISQPKIKGGIYPTKNKEILARHFFKKKFKKSSKLCFETYPVLSFSSRSPAANFTKKKKISPCTDKKDNKLSSIVGLNQAQMDKIIKHRWTKSSSTDR
jgi:hypothetical protein